MTAYVIVALYGCDRCVPYGTAHTIVVWSSFGQVWLAKHKKRILLECTCEALSGKRANPVQPLGRCGATVLKLSSCHELLARRDYLLGSFNKREGVALLGLYQDQSTG